MAAAPNRCPNVLDTGIGIPPSFLPYVFEKFRQEDASHTREHQGLGLGLTIARQFTELHGGTIAEVGAPSELFGTPRDERTRQFLRRVQL